MAKSAKISDHKNGYHFIRSRSFGVKFTDKVPLTPSNALLINPPDACILAVGGIKETAIVKDGQLVPGNVMKVTLSCDHRVVDGATGAAFLSTFKEILEDPVRILI